MKDQIIEGKDGRFYPQFNRGWLYYLMDPTGKWIFYESDADTSISMRQSRMLTRDPATAANFATEEEARALINRVERKASKFWNDVASSEGILLCRQSSARSNPRAIASSTRLR